MEQIDRRNARASGKQEADFVYEGSDDEDISNMPGNPRFLSVCVCVGVGVCVGV